MKNRTKFTALITLLFLVLQLAAPLSVRAALDMRTGPDGLSLIERYEGYSDQRYELNGRTYIGYGTACAADAYPDGITREEAEELLREALGKCESSINSFCDRSGLTPTQEQFDALVSFTFTLGDGWLSGTSDLVQIVRGDRSATRLETARAFGVWCHIGGKANTALAQRRLEEAALYLDGNLAAAKEEFAYLIIQKEDGVTYETDFSVYLRGGTYDSFPEMTKKDYQFTGLRTKDGQLIKIGDKVTGNAVTEAEWKKVASAAPVTPVTPVTTTYRDVKPEDWFYSYVTDLSAAGVINGRGNGIFAPKDSVTVGETLKLVLLATGNSEQKAVSKHWASGYVQLAQSKGYAEGALLSDLNAVMPRIEVARLAAKAMGLNSSLAATPFADANDGYLTALYEAGILTGSFQNGVRVYLPNDGISRAEISAVIWRIHHAEPQRTTPPAEEKPAEETPAEETPAEPEQPVDTTPKIVYNNTELPILEGVPVNRYDKSAFSRRGSVMTYSEPGVTTRLGIDVSRYQEEIDWEAVKASGIEFAILRVGGRYWSSGEIYADARFEEYLEGATEAGLDVGVYFYSQAITPAEAREEADYVLRMIRGAEINAPVVFDWELTGSSSARTNGIKTDVLCACARAFCDRVKQAGYYPMVYINKYAGYMKYDLSQIMDYDLWFAEYDLDAPTFYYDFQMWQYTSKGYVDGIKGKVDMNLWLIR